MRGKLGEVICFKIWKSVNLQRGQKEQAVFSQRKAAGSSDNGKGIRPRASRTEELGRSNGKKMMVVEELEIIR